MYGETKTAEFSDRAMAAPAQQRQISSKLDELQTEVDQLEKCYHIMTERLAIVLDQELPEAMNPSMNRADARPMVPLASQIDVLVMRVRGFNTRMGSLVQRVEL